MKKYTNKKQVAKKWQEKIESQKYYWNLLREKGDVSGSFYLSEVYRNLDRRRDRALWRYDNREKISEQRRALRETYKEQQRTYTENEGRINYAYDGSAINYMSGRKLENRKKLIASIRAQRFYGTILVMDEETGEVLEQGTHRSLDAYFSDAAKWNNELFSKKEGYKIFSTSISEKSWFDANTNTQFFSLEIIIGNE